MVVTYSPFVQAAGVASERSEVSLPTLEMNTVMHGKSESLGRWEGWRLARR